MTIKFIKRIDKNEIYIGSDCTTYCNLRLLASLPTKKEALGLRTSVINRAKELGGKVSFKNKTKKIIEEKAEQAHKEFSLYQKRYAALKAFVEKTMDGVETVSFEEKKAMDKDFDEIHRMRYEIEPMFYRNTVLSQYMDSLQLLNSHKDSMVDDEKSGFTIYL